MIMSICFILIFYFIPDKFHKKILIMEQAILYSNFYSNNFFTFLELYYHILKFVIGKPYTCLALKLSYQWLTSLYSKDVPRQNFALNKELKHHPRPLYLFLL